MKPKTKAQLHPAYKDSGEEWFMRIPEHWRTQPGFTIVSERNEKNIGLKEKQVLSLSYGSIVIKPEEKLIGLVPASFETYQVVYPGDIIIRTMDLQNDKKSLRVGFANDKGIISSAYLNLTVREGYEAKYYYYLLHTIDITKIIYALGSGLRQNLSYLDFKRFYFLVPTPTEQTRIAAFLDKKGAQIDQAIAQKERQIELLKEHRRILIRNAVTRGLNPTVKMKNSGVDWIGDIPEHWDVLPGLKFFKENNRRNIGLREERVLSLSYGRIIVKPLEKLVGLVPESFETYQIVKPGDIIIRCTDLQNDQTSLRTGIAFDDGIITSAYLNISVINGDNPEFLHYYLHALDLMKVFYKFGGGLRQNLSFVDFKRLPVVSCPTEEQDEIVKYLRVLQEKTDSACKYKIQEIEKLREYKATLINAAVTGKINV